MKPHFITSAAICALLATSGLAHAADPSDGPAILNEQLQFGDVFSGMTVVVKQRVQDDAVATVVSQGNTATAAADQSDLWFGSRQKTYDNTRADASVGGQNVGGTAVADSTSYGNALQVQTVDGDAGIDVYQHNKDVTTTATSTVDLNRAGATLSTANAAGHQHLRLCRWRHHFCRRRTSQSR